MYMEYKNIPVHQVQRYMLSTGTENVNGVQAMYMEYGGDCIKLVCGVQALYEL